MKRYGRVDANHAEIVRALKQIGASVESLAGVGGGCPDLLVGFRGLNLVFEIKDGRKPRSKQKLTELEELWHKTWSGQVAVVTSIQDALRLLGAR